MAGKFWTSGVLYSASLRQHAWQGATPPCTPCRHGGTSGLARPDTDAKDPLPLTRIFWCSHDCAAA